MSMAASGRRSAVSRTACHTVGLLSAALGPRFEGLALHLLPELFKMVVITVQARFSAGFVFLDKILPSSEDVGSKNPCSLELLLVCFLDPNVTC